jgi:hypothetical protein
MVVSHHECFSSFLCGVMVSSFCFLSKRADISSLFGMTCHGLGFSSGSDQTARGLADGVQGQQPPRWRDMDEHIAPWD